MKKLRLDNRQLLESYLRDVVREAVTIVEEKDDMDLAQASQREKERQDQTVSSIKASVPKGVKKEEDVEEAEDDEEETDKGEEKGDDEAKEKSGSSNKLPKHMHTELPDAEDITVDMVKDRLNVIRSGQSFRDEKVAVEMNHYFESLSSPERLALLSFLTGIAQVVTAGVEGERAPDPGDPGVDVVVKHANKKATRDQPSGEAPPQKKSAEDTSPPIAVGQKQATESIRRRIRKLL